MKSRLIALAVTVGAVAMSSAAYAACIKWANGYLCCSGGKCIYWFPV